MKETLKIEPVQEVLSYISGVAYANVSDWYDAGRRDLCMDLIVPKVRSGHKPCPVILWICGGAFQVVNRSVWLPEMVRYARAGYVVASIEYRTSNEAQFPAQLIDAKSAVRYLKAHAQQYCVDPDRIFVMGESAGGAIACLLGTSAQRRELDQGDYLSYNSAVAGVVDYYGLTDVTKVFTKPSKNIPYWTIDAFIGAGYSQEQAKAASAVYFVNESTPPHMILHGTADQVVDMAQSESYYETLRSHGVKAHLIQVEGAAHGDPLMYQDAVIDRILNFLRECAEGV